MDDSPRFKIREWSQRWPGIVFEPILLAAFGYMFLLLRTGALQFSPISLLFVSAASVFIHLVFLTRERYVVFESTHLTTHRFRSRYEPRDKLIAYEDIGEVEVNRSGEVGITYVGPHFWTRKPAKRRETFHPDDLELFLVELTRRVKVTGWHLEVRRK